MQLRFWGVRGSAATPGPATLAFGGNTSCVELQAGGEVVVFDGGTGIRELGLDLLKRATGGTLRIHLFLTHFHWDHIQGIPFFAPLYDPRNHVTIYSTSYTAPLKAALNGLMAGPYFPVPFDSLSARVDLVDLGGSSREIGAVTIHAFEANHPQGACGYRMAAGSSSAVYSPDREHGDARLDRLMVEECRGAGTLVIDSQYTPEEYDSHRGWGHSTWAESARVAREAGVKRLVLFHHDPSHEDAMLEKIQEDARRVFPETWVAREGWSVQI
jgi:phosphoribosyl 1,2-cyclic phosphodiesterase